MKKLQHGAGFVISHLFNYNLAMAKMVTVDIVYGINMANVIKSKLESYGIPVLLKYESVGITFGITLNGLGKVEIMVPQEYEEDAKILLNKDKNS